MPREIGYVHMAATILGTGMLNTIIQPCENYDKEKRTVNLLLRARFDIDSLPERSRTLFANIITQAIKKWWQESRYNVEIVKKITEIMDVLEEKIESSVVSQSPVVTTQSHHIMTRKFTSIVVDKMHIDEFKTIQASIDNLYPGLLSYHLQV